VTLDEYVENFRECATEDPTTITPMVSMADRFVIEMTPERTSSNNT
jgi:hypothetical protein